MNEKFSDKFGRITRTLAKNLYIMNQKRIKIVPYKNFECAYKNVVEDFNELKTLMMTIPAAELNTMSMKTYLNGLSCYLYKHITESNRKEFFTNLDNIDFDPYKNSIQIYRDIVKSGGRCSDYYS